MKIHVHCEDGTDPHCYGTVDIELPFLGIYEVRRNWTKESLMGIARNIVESIVILPKNPEDWINKNRELLDPSDIESIKKEGFLEIEYSKLEHIVCDACGSDQDYNEKGENISAV